MQSFDVTITDEFESSLDHTVGGLVWTTTTSSPSASPWRAAVATELNILKGPSDVHLDYWLPQNGQRLPHQ